MSPPNEFLACLEILKELEERFNGDPATLKDIVDSVLAEMRARQNVAEGPRSQIRLVSEEHLPPPRHPPSPRQGPFCKNFYGAGFPHVDTAIGFKQPEPRSGFEFTLEGRKITRIEEVRPYSGIAILCHIENTHHNWRAKVEHFTYLGDDNQRESRKKILRDYLLKHYPYRDNLSRHRTTSKGFQYFIDVVMADDPLQVPVPRK